IATPGHRSAGRRDLDVRDRLPPLGKLVSQVGGGGPGLDLARRHGPTKAPLGERRPLLSALRSASGRALDLADVRRLQPLGAAGHIEFDLITFRRALEAWRLNGGIVDEYVPAALLRDEPEALRVVEPLPSSRCNS